jgi:DNA-binding NarL/FixJ family response regulator
MSIQRKPPVRVLLADKHELIKIGVSTLLQSDPDLQLIGEADNFNDTLQLTRQLSPDVILLDITMKEGMIVERIPELPPAYPFCKIIVFTACADRDMHLLALKCGAVGVFFKDSPSRFLLKAIHSVYSGQVWLENSLAFDLLQSCRQAITPSIEKKLTSRELAVARLAAQGLPSKKIATKLLISDKTVRNLLVSIYDKLDVTGQIELVLQAGRLGLVSIELTS